VIVSGFPEIFAEFKQKKFTLLWRGSRDGFSAKTFHSRCDGHAPTLTFVLDTRGNVFGGFTPVKWTSPIDHEYGLDEYMRSFIFTLKNPRGIPPMKFKLKPGCAGKAVFQNPRTGPVFGADMGIRDQSNTGDVNYCDSFYYDTSESE
jgi:hypothetical protein